LNFNSPELLTVKKNTLVTLRDAKSNFDLYLVPLDENAKLFSLLVEVKDAAGDLISRGLYYSHTNEVRKFRLITALTFIQQLIPGQESIKVLTWNGSKKFK
jgi:hypothetical protein